jgi:hypothetical protein
MTRDEIISAEEAQRNRTGGPAFPWDGMGDDGMTLRDYFAAKAMAAQIQHAGCDNIGEEKLSEWAYVMADAMLKERSK